MVLTFGGERFIIFIRKEKTIYGEDFDEKKAIKSKQNRRNFR